MKKVMIVGSFVLAACQQDIQTHYILYTENEAGIDPFQTRVIVNQDFIRFDDGEGAPNYVLLDRQKQKIFSVNHDSRTIMTMQAPKPELESPIELKHDFKKIDDMQNAPDINGIKPVHYQFLTNDQVCLDVVTVDGLMPEAVTAYQEFQTILAHDSARTFANLPADLHEPCAISLSTFAPTRHLKFGFPIQEWKPGYSRSLVDYKLAYEAQPDIFSIPADYFTYSVTQFREGKVDLANRKVVE